MSLAAALQRSCVAFCTLVHAATAAAGPSLKESLVKLAQDMVNPCLALLKDMVGGLVACWGGSCCVVLCCVVAAPRKRNSIKKACVGKEA